MTIIMEEISAEKRDIGEINAATSTKFRRGWDK